MKPLIFFSFLLFFSCNLNTKTKIKQEIAEEKEEINKIKDVLETQRKYWNKGDIDGFMQGYWKSKDLIFTSASHKPAYGWKNTLKRYKNSYPNKESMGEFNYNIIDIRITSKTTALLNGTWKLIRKNDNPEGKFWLELESFNGKWLITKDSTISIID